MEGGLDVSAVGEERASEASESSNRAVRQRDPQPPHSGTYVPCDPLSESPAVVHLISKSADVSKNVVMATTTATPGLIRR